MSNLFLQGHAIGVARQLVPSSNLGCMSCTGITK